MARPSALRAREQLRQMMIALRTDHDVDHRRAADDLGAFRLRHATGDRDAHLPAVPRRFFLEQAQPPQLRIDLLGRLFADVAGVEDDQIGVVGVRGLGKAFARQRVHHALGIVDVHLAAVRLDVQLARRRHGVLTVAGRALRLAALRYRLRRSKIQRVAARALWGRWQAAASGSEAIAANSVLSWSPLRRSASICPSSTGNCRMSSKVPCAPAARSAPSWPGRQWLPP